MWKLLLLCFICLYVDGVEIVESRSEGEKVEGFSGRLVRHNQANQRHVLEATVNENFNHNILPKPPLQDVNTGIRNYNKNNNRIAKSEDEPDTNNNLNQATDTPFNNQITDPNNFVPNSYRYSANGLGRDEDLVVEIPGNYNGETVKGSYSYSGQNGLKYMVTYTATGDSFNLQSNKERPPSSTPASSFSILAGAAIDPKLLCSLQGTGI